MSLFLINDKGIKEEINVPKIRSLLINLSQNLQNINVNTIIEDTLNSIYDEIPLSQFYEAIILASRTYIEKDPSYSYLTARLLNLQINREVTKVLNVDSLTNSFATFIKYGIEQKRLNPKLKNFNLQLLEDAIDHSNNDKIMYLGLKTIYDRYLLRNKNFECYECPQFMLMRIAMGLSLNEKDFNNKAVEYYKLLSSFDFMNSTPTLFNSGTVRPQLSSCYLTTVPDDLSKIFMAYHDNAMLSKHAGGLGNDWTPVRASGSYIEGTGGQSQGVIPFLKVNNDTAIAVDQSGKRKGAFCSFLETWHLDIEDFLELRKNTGDERRRTHDMNTSNWVPDLFMERVFENKDWTLFTPSDVHDLHELSGKKFKHRYEYYESLTGSKITLFKKVKANDLWRKMLSMLFETGHPWICFKDPCNIRYTNNHIGVVHSSNLCFSGDTMVAVADGRNAVSIKQLAEESNGKIKFPVYSANLDLEHNEWNREIKTAIAFKTGTMEVIELELGNGKKFKCTPTHMLAITGYDGVDGEWMEARHTLGVVLSFDNPSDKIIDWDDWTVTNITYTKEVIDVYDLTVDDNHNFYILPDDSSKGILVHNCTEITLHTNEEEIAVCNLGSINLVNHIDNTGKVLKEKLEKTVTTAIRILDNVVDINYYPVQKAKTSNLKHRPIGLGIMGFHDILYIMKIPYASEKAVFIADYLMELISFYAIKASMELAKERGAYSTFKGSLWSKGILPIDSLKRLQKERSPQYSDFNYGSSCDWNQLREDVKTYGMRNSNVMAIAPTATISNICGVSQAIDPTYQNLFVKSNLSGEFTVINPYLVKELKALNLWNDQIIDKLKYYDGSLESIEEIPENIKELFKTAFEIEPEWIIKAGARRQKWIDQAQSLNLYIKNATGKKLDEIYKLLWTTGCKTSYYLRTLAASNVEKSSITTGVHNLVTPVINVCSIDNPDCEACQ
jgi:ribonucleotide reductase alpha subunit